MVSVGEAGVFTKLQQKLQKPVVTLSHYLEQRVALWAAKPRLGYWTTVTVAEFEVTP